MIRVIKRKKLVKMFLSITMNQDIKELFSVDSSPINEDENIRDIFQNSTVLNSIFMFRQATGQTTDHLSCRVQLVETIFNEYANERLPCVR